MGKEVGNRIREKRLQLSLSQEELAKKLNVNRTTVAKWESGDNNLKQTKVTQLAKALECSPVWLMGLEDDDSKEVDYKSNSSQTDIDNLNLIIDIYKYLNAASKKEMIEFSKELYQKQLKEAIEFSKRFM